MHLLQWMQSDDGGRAGPHAVDEVGLAQQGPGHGHELEALARARWTVASSLMPPSRMSGRSQGRLELAGVGEEERLLEGVGCGGSGDRAARKPSRTDLGRVAAELLAAEPRRGSGTWGWPTSCRR